MSYKQDEDRWWSPEEWASNVVAGLAEYGEVSSVQMVRRYCRQAQSSADKHDYAGQAKALEKLGAGAVRKDGRFWRIRLKPLTDRELKTEACAGAAARLALLGVRFNGRMGSYTWEPDAAELASKRVTGAADPPRRI